MIGLIQSRADQRDFRLQVALGLVPGITGVRKFGHNEAVATAFVDVWDGGIAYPFPTAASVVRIAAGGDAADTAAGAGAREVEIQGLDENWELATATLATNGALASVDTTITFVRVFRVKVTDSGAYGAKNVAAISIETNPGGVELARVPALHGQTQMAIYTVPANKRAVIIQYEVTVDTAQTFDVRLWKREDADITSAPFTSPRLVGEFHGVNDRAWRDFCVFPEVLPPKTDVWIDAKANSGTNNKLSAEFDLWLVDA